MKRRCFYREYTDIFLLLVVHPIGLKRSLAAAPTVSLPTGSKGNNTRLRLFLGPQALTDANGCGSVSSDMYLRLAGRATGALQKAG